jgi:UDP-N-acetylmuramate: L-alanyl-gamma-D-glutamyl-meso-diaminopimelate ligase
MHVHILGICGTFMGGIAALAQAMGHKVTGSDANVYPPMSTQLTDLGIALTQGYSTEQFSPVPDMVIVGNAMSRGNPAVEYVLERNIPYTSGPQWLLDNFLKEKWVLAVSGTHGKTTTSSMLAWILEHAGMKPGFLIGGIPQNFGVSARLGDSPFFVIEADEYDTAFFDKRSKFVHYRPRTLVMNNLEFDHADIFADLAAIQTQFHHLIRMVPNNGLVLYPHDDKHIKDTLDKGCWTPCQTANHDWQVNNISDDGCAFDVVFENEFQGRVKWNLQGEHNRANGLMAIAAARHVGVRPVDAIDALNTYINTKRRMEVRGCVNDITVYDDFAHHPTAIETTLKGLRDKVGMARVFAVLEPRSNTMKMGVHKNTLTQSWQLADAVLAYQAKQDAQQSSLSGCIDNSETPAELFDDLDLLINQIAEHTQAGDHVVIMSNGGFGGIHEKLLNKLRVKHG